MVQMLFPNNDTVFQDDDWLIYTTRSVQSWFEEHEDALQQLLWLAHLPTLNIIEPLWSVLESRLRNRFPQLSLKKLEDEWYSIPLDTSELARVYSKKDTSCVTGKQWSNNILIKKCIFHSCFHYFYTSPAHAAKLNSLG